jgi:hypothetical protein
MFEYAFVQVTLTFIRSNKIDRSSYQSVIEENAKNGWRLVQVLVETPAAMPSEYTLIFERPVAA